MSPGKIQLLQNGVELQNAGRPRDSCSAPAGNVRYFAIKNFLDRCLAVVLLIPGTPAIGMLMLLVRLTSRGPAIYRQKRVGKHGQEFVMLKIRTMRHDAEEGLGAVWTRVNDPRITRLGWFLRKMHLDELPQLFNVLRGEMSLVGPRPERPEFVAVLSERIPHYQDRLTVLPGVTGLAQINLPPDTDLASVRRKQMLDLHYIRIAGFWLDLRMMICTSLRLMGLSGHLAAKLMRLEIAIPVERYAGDSFPAGDLVPRAGSAPPSWPARTSERLRGSSALAAEDEFEPGDRRFGTSAAVRKPVYFDRISGNGNSQGDGAAQGEHAGGSDNGKGRPRWTVGRRISRWLRVKKPK